jgi:hypothetical protein
MSAPNRAERRRQSAEWRKRMRAIVDEAGGAYHVELVRLDSPPHPYSQRTIGEWLVATLNGGLRPLCLDCDAEFGRDLAAPAAFMLVTPHRENPEGGIVTGICSECAAHADEDLIEVALKRLRVIWPDARLLPIEHFHATGGRA